jgi:mono/diheme cytochrome c family protein
MSKDAWSSCGSCHPEGLADGVTWIFGTGPRQTKPLDGMFNKFTNMEDQGLLNWSAIRGSNTDFNNNSRGVQGSCGFASDDFDPGQCFAKGATALANPAIYDHGIIQGASEALDAQTLWIFAAVRALNQPQPSNVTAGRAVFATYCASCHGARSGRRARSSTAITQPPLPRTVPPWTPVSLGLRRQTSSSRSRATTSPSNISRMWGRSTSPILWRSATTPPPARRFGVNGFNVPSLLSVNYHAPYLHRGQAQTLAAVFPLHGLGAGGSRFPPTTTIETELTASQRADLLVFLKSIDSTTPLFRSEADDFRDALRTQGTCPPPAPRP